MVLVVVVVVLVMVVKWWLLAGGDGFGIDWFWLHFLQCARVLPRTDRSVIPLRADPSCILYPCVSECERERASAWRSSSKL